MFKIKITNNLYNYKVTDSCLMKLFNDNAFNKFEMIWTKHKSADINEVLLQPIVSFTMLTKASDYCLAVL